jgi:hypothetical protein
MENKCQDSSEILGDVAVAIMPSVLQSDCSKSELVWETNRSLLSSRYIDHKRKYAIWSKSTGSARVDAGHFVASSY